MEEKVAEKIAKWHYAPPFSFYDLESDKEDLKEFLNPATWENRTFTGFNTRGDVVGFFSIDFDPQTNNLDIGLGLAPEYTGKKIGGSFILQGLVYAKTIFRYKSVSLKVWKENTRAIACYSKLGFKKIYEFDQFTNGGTFRFIEMKMDAS